MQTKVEHVLRAHDFFSPLRHILVACSGGVDSLALLDVLDRFRRAGGAHITCAHVEHGIRGVASRADARFVKDYCAVQGIPFTCAAVDAPAYARAHRMSLETSARILRYEFLYRAREECGCDCIATAHHADDLAETVLMRILRGTGTAGLAAMREWDGVLLRPLLTATRAEIVSYARARALAPRSDETNEMCDAMRNRIRNKLLPILRADYNPAVGVALVRLSTLAREEDEFIAELSADALRRAEDAGGLSTAVLCGLHPALQRRVLRLYWQTATAGGKDFSYLHEEQMRSLIFVRGVAQIDMPHGYTAVCQYGRLILKKKEIQNDQPKDPEIILPIEREYAIIDFQDFQIRTRRIRGVRPADCLRRAGAYTIYADAAHLPPLILRTRRAGDYLRLPVGQKKLKKILIDDRVPQEQRNRMPLIAVAGGSEILWIVGGRRSILAPLTEETGEIVEIKCVKETIAT